MIPCLATDDVVTDTRIEVYNNDSWQQATLCHVHLGRRSTTTTLGNKRRCVTYTWVDGLPQRQLATGEVVYRTYEQLTDNGRDYAT